MLEYLRTSGCLQIQLLTHREPSSFSVAILLSAIVPHSAPPLDLNLLMRRSLYKNQTFLSS